MKKALAFLYICALLPSAAFAQSAYFPPQMQAAPEQAPQEQTPSVSQFPELPMPDAGTPIYRHAPDPYTASVWHQDFSNLKGEAILIFWAAGCGVIGQPGNYGFNYSIANAALGNAVSSFESQDGYIPVGQERIDVLLARQDGIDQAKNVGCSFWEQHPDIVSDVRQAANE